MTLDVILGLGAAVVLVLAVVVAAVRIVPEYERGVIFRLGKVIGARDPDCSSSFRSSIA